MPVLKQVLLDCQQFTSAQLIWIIDGLTMKNRIIHEQVATILAARHFSLRHVSPFLLARHLISLARLRHEFSIHLSTNSMSDSCLTFRCIKDFIPPCVKKLKQLEDVTGGFLAISVRIVVVFVHTVCD